MENYFYYDFFLLHHHRLADFDYVGVIAHKAREKVVLPDSICTAPCQRGAATYRFKWTTAYQWLHGKSVLAFSLQNHGQVFVNCWRDLLLHLRFNMSSIMSPRLPKVYFNYWLAKPDIFYRYSVFIADVRRAIFESEADFTCMFTDAEYGKPLVGPFRYLGKWTQHPFMFERLLPLFLLSNNLNPEILVDP